jgi:hypothetical protein
MSERDLAAVHADRGLNSSTSVCVLARGIDLDPAVVYPEGQLMNVGFVVTAVVR